MTANILVVDDIDQNIRLMEAKLVSEYYTVYTATSGKQALDILKRYKIDVVLLDCMMPEMDGFALVKKIKQLNKFSTTPIIALTATATEKVRQDIINQLALKSPKIFLDSFNRKNLNKA